MLQTESTKRQMDKPAIDYNKSVWFVVLIILIPFFFFFLYAFDYLPLFTNIANQESYKKNSDESCSGRYIYVHDLPQRFNDDILENCTTLYRFYNMCPFLKNSGFGVQVVGNYPDGEDLGQNWFATNQFSLEIIFRTRMNYYDCLTNDSSLASAVFVPYYGGLDVARYLWDYSAARDYLGVDLVNWLTHQPEWTKMWGRDHFFVSGRVAFDFHRQIDQDSGWGTKFMSLPESMNMTMLSIESTAWSNEFAIPYPTHFHPSSDNEVMEWQNRMRKQKRKYLFTFAGAPRPSRQDSIRGQIIEQCLASTGLCNLLDCGSGTKCDNPVEVIRVFQDSVFCLHPSGDTYTRRAAFDSIIAGCIPVFFHPGSAYVQYEWYLPNNYSKYSVFIPENLVMNASVSINETLIKISNGEIMKMREEVIKLIPKILYANPKSKLESSEDAFDIAIKGVLDRVEKVRNEINEGKDPAIGFAEPNWKLRISRMGLKQDWSHFF